MVYILWFRGDIKVAHPEDGMIRAEVALEIVPQGFDPGNLVFKFFTVRGLSLRDVGVDDGNPFDRHGQQTGFSRIGKGSQVAI
nr:hypothetical protein [Desulforamulus profundi]